MTDDHLSRLELRRRQLLAKMRANDRLLDDIRTALGGERIVRHSKDPAIVDYEDVIRDVANDQRHQRNRLERDVSRHGRFPVDHPYDLDRRSKADILWAWADGYFRTTEACERLNCTPSELLDTAMLHEVEFPAGLKQPTYTLREDGPWTTVEILLANGFELIVTGAEDIDWPTDDPDVVAAALRGQDQAVIIIVDNSFPAEGWENVGYIHLRAEGEEFEVVDYRCALPSIARLLDADPFNEPAPLPRPR
ncbi:hypothetical protein [Rhizobium laguerreae]|uniref:hypothetical protein n=1 Tax=Rhizobium laguerreae TaxID=1076926 RepID=UPI001C909BA8|nr:hypothetical protein [Rhizobium laguerreae]MBY3314703.1 hypothetical protein [Rhizobium laguerreae]